MGAGKWNTETFRSYATTTGYTTQSREQVFTSRQLPAELDPSKIQLRESCDSADNPLSTPIILALDVTGSMGEYAELIAKQHLPKLMEDILEQRPVTDPHLMFMGVDDVHASRGGSLQVSQFEADIRIIEQLRQIWLVGGGGGNNSESYDLAWYFAAKRTAIHSFDKRGKKGFLFTFGDEEAPYENLSERDLELVLGPGEYKTMSPAASLAAAKEQYHVFHVVIEQGNHCIRAQSREKVISSWTELMGPNVLFLRDAKDLPALVLATLRVVGGEDLQQVIDGSSVAGALQHAFRNSLEG